jgi:hypothetical protein
MAVQFAESAIFQFLYCIAWFRSHKSRKDLFQIFRGMPIVPPVPQRILNMSN